MSKPKNRAEELMDELLKGKTTEEIIGEEGLLTQLTKSLMERALQGEMTHHLGYSKHDPVGNNTGNSRNGKSRKTVKGDFGEIKIEVPRDRNADFEPKIIPKNQTRFPGFDEQILSMYARGMTTRDIAGHLKQIYKVDVSADLISEVTDSVMQEVQEWQNRLLDPIYPILFLDAIRLPIRDNGHVIKKAIYLAIGVKMTGTKEILGIWVEQNEGARFWLQIITEIKNRGVNDILIAVVDGLKGLPEAIESVYPDTRVQLCIVHQIRNSTKYVSFKDRREVSADLKTIYAAVNESAAGQALEAFASKWDTKYPMISKSWRHNWIHLTMFLAFPAEIRKAIYTTNAIESINNGLKKVTKNRAAFPNDGSAVKLLYLALQNLSKKWTMPIRNWGPALHQFAIAFEGRVQLN